MTIQVIHGNALEVLPTLSGLDACVCDPPYHLTSIVDRFGAENAAPAQFGKDGAYARASHGFMGKQWDGGDVALRPETWRLVFGALKPGAHLIAFGGTRTYHRMACAIEDAGFEIRDTLCWLYGTGFPKSHDVSKGIDKAAGIEREVLAAGAPVRRMIPGADQNKDGWIKDAGREFVPTVTAPATPEAQQWQGWGTALKPAHEPIIIARKPLSEKTVAANVLRHGTGAINIDACRVAHSAQDGAWGSGRSEGSCWSPGRTNGGSEPEGKRHDLGRWPANVLHDGSEEVEAAFAAFGSSKSGEDKGQRGRGGIWTPSQGEPCGPQYGDSGSASRFFAKCEFTPAELRLHYSGKADAGDRISRPVEEVSIEWTSEQGRCRLVLQADTGQSPEKAIVVSGSGDAKEWSMFLCGSGITDLCRKASTCTISTKTNSTTRSRTWKSLINSLTNASTGDAEWSTENGSSHAESVRQNILSATITVGTMAYLPGANHVASGTQLKISVSAKRTGHPTCKPIALMRWLVRLVTPPGGSVLDCFAGSGTTGEAARLEGFSAILIEREAEYIADIHKRLGRASGDDTPLFAEIA